MSKTEVEGSSRTNFIGDMENVYDTERVTEA